MNPKSTKTLILWPLAALLLSCGGNGPAPSASSEDSSFAPPSIDSLKQGMRYLRDNKDYTLSFSSVAGKASFYFTPSSVGFAVEGHPELNQSLYEDGTGIYKIHYDGGYLASDYLLDSEGEYVKDVYANAATTLYGVSSAYVEKIAEDAEKLLITDKSYRMAFIQAVGYTRNDYLHLNSLEASYAEGTLRFTLSLSEETNVYVLSSLGTTVDPNVSTYLASGGGALILDEYLDEARRLMKGDNFTRLIYDFDAKGYVGQEVFTEHYFYGSYTGGMEFDNPDLNLYGVYYFSVVDGQVSFLSRPIYEEPSVEQCYHYPTFMALWSQMEYLKEGGPGIGDYDYQGEAYTLYDEQLILDFAKNNSLTDSYDPSVCVPEAVGLDVELGIGDEDTVVTFVYYFTYQGTLYTMPLPFSRFHDSNIAGLDRVYEQYNNAKPA